MRHTLIFILVLFTGLVTAQGTYIDTVQVGFTKSAYIIFDDTVKVDFGSLDIAVRHPGNKVIIQANVEDFEETNLLVECNGEFFLFLVQYNDNPKHLFFNYQTNARKSQMMKSDGVNVGDKPQVQEVKKDLIMTDHALARNKRIEQEKKDSINNYYAQYAEKILNIKPEIYNRGSVLGKVTFQVTNIGTVNDEFYFRVKIHNRSKISYDMDYLGWVVRDVKTKIKGESKQDLQLFPNHIYNESSRIDGKSFIEVVYIFPKFVFGKDKKLSIEAWEDNGGLNEEGGRKMEFSIFSSDIQDVREL